MYPIEINDETALLISRWLDLPIEEADEVIADLIEYSREMEGKLPKLSSNMEIVVKLLSGLRDLG